MTGPLQGDDVGTVFDRAAPTYGQVGPDFFRDLGNLLVERATIPAGSRIIDVCAGTGAVSLAASRKVGPGGSVLAIEVAPKMLTQLRHRLDGYTSTRFTTAVMDAGFLGVRSSTFDVAPSGIALQSMPDPQAAVTEMCRVVRSAGSLGASVSTGWWWEEDPRWQWHATLLDDLGVTIGEAPPSSGEHFLSELLSHMPLCEVEQTHHVLEFEFEDADTFWAWCWSHGWRGVMERLATEQLGGYREGASYSIGDGPVPFQLVADLATANHR